MAYFLPPIDLLHYGRIYEIVKGNFEEICLSLVKLPVIRPLALLPNPCGGVAGAVAPAEGGAGSPAKRGCRQGGVFPPLDFLIC
jgi:hypothetical protein